MKVASASLALPGRPSGKTPSAARLRVGPPGDAFERAADRAAERVMTMLDGEFDKREGRLAEPVPGVPRRVEAGAGDLPEAPPLVNEVLHSPGQPLDAATRAFFEPRFGHDFGRVRVHADSKASASARAVGAQAYAVGNHVVLVRGRSDPGSAGDRRLLAHELAHVTQSLALQAADVVRRLPPGPNLDEPSAPAAEPAAAPAPAPAAPAVLAIEDSVGLGGANKPADVARIQERLAAIGLLSTEDAANESPLPSAQSPMAATVESGDAAAAAEAANVPAEELQATIEAIVALQTLLFTKGKPDGLIQAEPNRPTLKALGTLSAEDVVRLRAAYQARQEAAARAQARKQAAAEAKAEAEAQAAYERSPEAAAARLAEAQQLVRAFGYFIPWTDQYMRLDGKGLGARLSVEAPRNPKVVLAALDQLYAGDRAQVVFAMAGAMDDATLGSLDTDLAVRIHAEAGASAEGTALRRRLVDTTLAVAAIESPRAADVKPEQWVTDQYWTGTGDARVKRQCFDACRMMLDNFNAEAETDLAIGGRTQMLPVLAEDPAAKTLNLLPTSGAAAAYIDEQLAKGFPVIAGTHYQFLSLTAAYNEGTTDHFVLIVGKGKGTYTDELGDPVEAPYYQYYDPGRSAAENGTSAENRLYLHADTQTWEGTTPGGGRHDVLSQVRPFTRDYTDEMLKVFEENATRIADFDARKAAAKEAANPKTAAKGE